MKIWLLETILFATFITIDAVLTTRTASFPIGGLFNKITQPSSYEAFNRISELGGVKAYHGRSLLSDVVDTYSTSLRLCSFTSDGKGVVALIDSRPTNGICDTACLLCNRLHILHLALGWEPPQTIAEDIYTFLYHPPPDLISKAYATLIKNLQWDKFSILYEDDSSFIRLQEIINTWPQDRDPIIFRKLDPEGDNKEIFKHIFKVAKVTYHVLDCDVNNVHKYMNEIVQVENSTEYLSFILTNLDTYSIDLKNIPDLMANVSTMHLTTTNTDRWRDLGMNTEAQPIRLETALLADALAHIEKAMRKMQGQDAEDDSFSLDTDFTDPPSMCFKESKAAYEEIAWPLGDELRDILLNTTTKGFTGNIEFDEEGRRKNFVLHYSKLDKESQFIYVGDWESTTGMIKTENKVSDRSRQMKSNKIRVATRVGKPYFDFIESNETMQHPYKGYAVDLVHKIFEIINKEHNLNLEYEFYQVEGNKYGNPVSGSKKWDGLIGDLMEHKADIAICDLTITSERNSVVDFSVPFMTLGISMLFRDPEEQEPNMFSFLEPLALDVWLYLATTYIIISFVLLICARMSQDDWVNPHPCNQNPEHLQNIWSLYNCMWLAMGTIMTQGCDILPRAAGSRWVTGMWWFFALIVTASYTANMSTFLSNSRRDTDIDNVKALSEQTQISYGALLNGSTYKFFKDSNDSVYQTIWSVMSSAKPKPFTDSNEQGKERVLKSKGKYVFFMESVTIEYYKYRICELKMVGDNLDSKEYGIAMPKNYPFKLWIDYAILSLQESGILTELKKKWWEQEDNEKHCEVFVDLVLHLRSPNRDIDVKSHVAVISLAFSDITVRNNLEHSNVNITAWVAGIEYMGFWGWLFLSGNLMAVKKTTMLQKEGDDDDNGLQMKNTSGIFLVLGFGGIMGLLVAIADFLLHAREICVKEKITFKEAIMSEWRASLDPRVLHKSAAPPRSAPPSTASPSPRRERSQSRAVSVLRAASSFINFDEIY